MSKMDAGYQLTDQALAELEQRIYTVYDNAAIDLNRTATDYFSKLEGRDAKKQEQLANGEITVEEYRSWRTAQVGRGQRFEQMRDNMAQRATAANEVAMSYVNDAMANVYAINHNYGAYMIDSYSDGVDFTLMDETTVRRLLVEQPDLMPNYPEEKAVNRGIDLAWGKQKITQVVTSNLIRGTSIPQITRELTSTITGMNRTSAVRAARTAATNAQNAGRQDMLNQAVAMGINAKKMWIATKDLRTRESHVELDGVTVAYNKDFPNGCEYPGDGKGTPAEVYNCRCCLGYVLPETEDEFSGDGQYSTGNTVESYQEWLEEQWAAKSAGGWGGFAQQTVSKEHKKVVSDNFTDKPSEQFMNDFNAALEKCPDTVRDMYGNNAGSLDIANAHYKGGAFYRQLEDGIFINEKDVIKGEFGSTPMQTAFHEWGHQLDYVTGRKLGLSGAFSNEYNGGALLRAIQQDYANLATKCASDLGWDAKRIRSKAGKLDAIRTWIYENDPTAKAIKENGSEYWRSSDEFYQVYGAVSDIFESQSGVKAPLGVGHGVSYWKTRGPCKEFWAEYCEGYCDTAGGDKFREMFPTACSVCDEMAEIVAYGVK